MRLAKFVLATVVISLAVGAPAWANLMIVPTFGPVMAADLNAANIEAAINSAISVYQANFSDNITVNIFFEEMSTGLGQSTKTIYTLPYTTFRTALSADAKTSDDATALANSVPNTVNNPVTNNPNIVVSTANIKALNIAGSFPSVLACGATCDGDIRLNTHLTFPGSSDTTSTYSLMVVAEHEIDEVLGLGSALPSNTTTPWPEDLFRYTAAAGVRSFTASTSGTAFFSINGTLDLAEFNNQQSGADFGDWRSNPLPAGAQPKVQDAFATPGATPALSVELRALDVIGWDLVTVPEPGTVGLLATALAVLAGLAKRRAA